MDNKDLENVMRRIEKLLALANCPGANENEAAAAAAMAEKIMRKYQLEHGDIIIASLKRGAEMTTDEMVVTAKTNGTKVEKVPRWASIMALKVSQLCETGAIATRTANGEKGIRFFGFEPDVKMSIWMLSYLVGVVNSLCIKFREEDARYVVYGRKAVNAYRSGLATGICSQIAAIIEERKKENTTSTGKELVVVKQEAIELHFSMTFEPAKSVSTINRNTTAFNDGFKKGINVDLTRRGVEGSNPLHLEKK